MNVSSVNYAARALRLRLPRVCVAVTGEEPSEMMDKAEAIIRENHFLEFRLDYLKNPAAAIPKIRKLFDFRPDVVAIATCRRAANGGRFKGSVAAQLEVLEKAAAAGCQIVDVEIETAEAMKAADWEHLRPKGALMISYHDFKGTKDLDATFERMKALKPDFYKVVSTATSLHDNVVMMEFLQRNSDQHSIVGLCMGEQGIISRVLSVRAGSMFTFAAANAGEETGPGQVTLRELRDTFRIEQVDAVTKVYGVAGDPVNHSKSPAMMNTAFRRENVHGVYLPLHCRTLDDLLACVKTIPLHGISVTMPYKRDIVPHLDNSDTLTSQTGACNTVVRGQDGRLFGFNTDVAGIIGPLERALTLKGSKILVIGAGGAASAAVVGLRARGAEVFIVNRTPQHAQTLAKKTESKVVKRTELPKLQFDAIINATSVGMGNPKQSPLEENEINAQIVFDLVYNPLETKLLKCAREKGLTTISGLEMFVQQGVRQFEIWTGKPAPEDEMRNAVLRQLGEAPLPTPTRKIEPVIEEEEEREDEVEEEKPEPPKPTRKEVAHRPTAKHTPAKKSAVKKVAAKKSAARKR